MTMNEDKEKRTYELAVLVKQEEQLAGVFSCAVRIHSFPPSHTLGTLW